MVTTSYVIAFSPTTSTISKESFFPLSAKVSHQEEGAKAKVANQFAIDDPPTSRSNFFRTTSQTAGTTLLASLGTVGSSAQTANAASTTPIEPKMTNLSNEDIAKIVKSDMVDNSFLATAKLTRSIYDESSIFTDEIDSYPIEKWIKGTQKLFVGPPSSNVQLDGDVVATDSEVTFRFAEDLMFRIPPLYPVVTLSGKVILERDLTSGLITSYREVWDQDVNTVLKTAQFPSFFKSPAENV